MADLPDDTRPEPADLLAGLIADTRDRTERADVLGALDGIDEAMTANYRLTDPDACLVPGCDKGIHAFVKVTGTEVVHLHELDYPDLAYAIDKGGDDLDGPVTLNNEPTGDAMRCTPQEDR